jgi:hypothetical protein
MMFTKPEHLGLHFKLQWTSLDRGCARWPAGLRRVALDAMAALA